MKTKHNSINNIAIAACLTTLNSNTPSEFRILPSGTFKARDGRPVGLNGWFIDAEIASVIIEQVKNQQDQLMIDYEHQTLNASKNGQPNPASGWFKELEWRDDGLYALNVDWTEKASSAISAKEYRYISPVFTFDKTTGAVTSLLMAALVNTPALDDLTDLSSFAASLFSTPTHKESTMDIDELLERLRYTFNLPALATVDEIIAEVNKLKTLVASDPAVAAGVSIIDVLATKNSEIAALKSSVPDPAQFVPVTVMAALQSELSAIKNDLAIDKVGKLVTAALSDGRLLPAQKEWAEKLGKSDLAALSSYLDTAQPIAALNGTQTGGKSPDQKPESLTADEIAMCKNMGITEAQFLASKEVAA